MKKILFYIEPWIELNIPFWKRDYIWWFKNNIESAFKANTKVESLFVINEGIEANVDTSSMENYEVIYQHELIKIFSSSISSLKNWQNNTFSETEMNEMQKLIKLKLKLFEPDIIFTISPVPYLSKLYPKAKIFYKHGFNMREPFPDEMLSFEHLGLYGNSVWAKNINFFKNKKLNNNEKLFIDDFRSIFRPIFERMASQNEIIFNDLKIKNFKKILLFPLQHNDHNIYRHSTNYLLPAMIEHVFSSLDPKIGVLVTQHPDSMLLTNDEINYFKNKYINFLYLDKSEKRHSPSQELLPLTDGILSVASHLSFLALILKKPVFTVADSHINKFSDNNNISEINTLLQGSLQGNDFKDSLLYFFIKKYNFNYKYFLDHDWLFNRFTTIDSSITAENYPEIDEDNYILDSYIELKRLPKYDKDLNHDSVTKRKE